MTLLRRLFNPGQPLRPLPFIVIPSQNVHCMNRCVACTHVGACSACVRLSLCAGVGADSRLCKRACVC
jgi:hypothetical protein